MTSSSPCGPKYKKIESQMLRGMLMGVGVEVILRIIRRLLHIGMKIHIIYTRRGKIRQPGSLIANYSQ